MNLKYFFVLFLFVPFLSGAQIGGENTYEFLNLVNSARMGALGGNQVALADETDLNVSYNNPALLTEEMQSHLVANYVNYISDVNYGYVAYALPVDWPGNFAVGMHYINYGTFIEALPNGLKTGGTFKAAEYALNIIWSYPVRPYIGRSHSETDLVIFRDVPIGRYCCRFGSQLSKRGRTFLPWFGREKYWCTNYCVL